MLSGISDLFEADAGEPLRPALPGAELEYFPHFVDQATANGWFGALKRPAAIAWRQDHIVMYGRRVPIPRLNAWYGDAGLNYSYSGIPMAPEPWTPLLSTIREQVEACTRERYTSALVNLYRDGRDSVAWHADDEPELGPRPVIASLSLGATREFQLRHRHYRDNGLPVERMLLTAGSLLVMRGETQQNWLHQVPKRSLRSVPGARINITFRKILKHAD